VLGAVHKVLMIWALTSVLIYEAVLRLIADIKYPPILDNSSNNDTTLFGSAAITNNTCPPPHSAKVDGKIMLIVASCGLAINIIDAVILWWGGQSHAGHSHGDEEHGHDHDGHDHGDEHGNLNVRSAFLHVLGDCIQSLGVIAAAVVIWVWPKLQWMDPVATFVFSIMVLLTTWGLIKSSVSVLMESVPKGVVLAAIEKDLLSLNGITEVHDLHVWSLTVGKPALSVHVKSTAEPHEVLQAANKMLKERHRIKHTTIQVSALDCDHGIHPECKF